MKKDIPVGPKCLNLLVARPRRLERPTPFLGGRYSIQLSYGRVLFYKEVYDIFIDFFSRIFVKDLVS